MGSEYRLTLAGPTPAGEIARRAFPEDSERPTGTAAVLSAGLYDSHGFAVTIGSGVNGYFDAESDDGGTWEWKPATYVSVNFDFHYAADYEPTVRRMLTVIGRLLDTGPEDGALVLDGNYLLFTRRGGANRKYRPDRWWTTYASAAADRIPG